jgi:hypothetical protein
MYNLTKVSKPRARCLPSLENEILWACSVTRIVCPICVLWWREYTVTMEAFTELVRLVVDSGMEFRLTDLLAAPETTAKWFPDPAAKVMSLAHTIGLQVFSMIL